MIIRDDKPKNFTSKTMLSSSKCRELFQRLKIIYKSTSICHISWDTTCAFTAFFETLFNYFFFVNILLFLYPVRLYVSRILKFQFTSSTSLYPSDLKKYDRDFCFFLIF